MPRKTSKGLLAGTKTAQRDGDLSAPLFVLLSDLHAHPWAAFAKGDGTQNTRLRASLLILEVSLEKALELEVPWVFAGDIVHTAGYSLNVVLSEIASLLCLKRYKDVVKLAVWGNHDARGVGGKILLEQTVLRGLMLAAKNFTVLDPTTCMRYTDPKTGLTYSGAGYQPRREFLTYGQEADVGVYHQTISGSLTPSGFALEEGIQASELLERHNIVVVGHVHHWQYHPAAKDTGKVLLIPGSPEYQNFGDAGTHGWWIIGRGEEQFVPGGSPEFRTVETPDLVQKDGHFYRVRSAPKGSAMPEGAVAIAPSPSSIESRDLLHGARGVHTVDAWMKASPPESELPLERFAEAGRQLVWAQDTGTMRAVRLQHLLLHNFCSYAHQEFTVQPGTWLVVGQGRDFPSNGAGKSSMFEAVRWLLFGTTTKGLSGDEVIRWGTDECEVTATLVDDKGAWVRISRTRGKSSRLEIEHQHSGLMEAKSVVEMTEKLGQYLGLTPELHQALGYFSQEKLLLFASATDGERKDMLADLIGLAMYQEASSRATKKCQECEVADGQLKALSDAALRLVITEQDRLNDTLAKAIQWKQDWEVRKQQASSAIDTWKAGFEAEHARIVASERVSLGATFQRRLKAAQDRYTTVTAKLATPRGPEHTEAELTKARAASTLALGELTKVRGTLEETNRQIATYKKRLTTQQQQLAQGMCPACGQEIAEDHAERCLAPLHTDIAAAEQRAIELSAQQQAALTSAADYKRVHEEVAAGVQVRQLTQQLVVEEQRITQELQEIETAQQEMEAVAQKLAMGALQNQETVLAEALKRTTAERNPYAVEATGAKTRIATATDEVRSLEQRRVLQLEDLAIHDYWRRGFSKQGIQSLLVDEVAVLFNSARGAIFPALTQGVYDAQFSTVSQTKTGEWRERTEFQVFEHGELVQYEALSGGQRRRIDVGVMLTLVKAVSKWMQVPGVLGMLVLDEVCGFLDASGAEGLMEALREVQEQIPSIFVITHDSQLQALFPEVIVVQQDADGVSSILASGEAT